jgi:hypothetical protein
MGVEMQEIITRMVSAMERMAEREFAELPLGNSPFEISFPLEDDSPDQAQSICEGLLLGLSRIFGPSNVSARVEGSHYMVRIDR